MHELDVELGSQYTVEYQKAIAVQPPSMQERASALMDYNSFAVELYHTSTVSRCRPRATRLNPAIVVL